MLNVDCLMETGSQGPSHRLSDLPEEPMQSRLFQRGKATCLHATKAAELVLILGSAASTGQSHM